MKIYFILLVCIYFEVSTAASLTNQLLNNWESFKSTNNKQYKHGLEEKYRFKVFRDNLKIIDKHNKRYDQGKVTFKMGVNKFADLTHEEFRSAFTCFQGLNASRHHKGSTFLTPNSVKLPSQVDWRNEGYVTAVKNQGACGSCWAFSTTGSLEGQNFKKSGQLVSLSEQNLVDCSREEGNEGCNGGLMDNAFNYIQMNHGIDTEMSYPYEGRDDTCKFNPQNIGATVSGHVDIPEGNERKLTEALATVGPISVAIDVTQQFQLYHSGVYDDDNCNSETLNHGVLVVGYGTEDAKDYYIVKNSWGENWGQNGYILMSRNKKNQCGIASAASYPLV